MSGPQVKHQRTVLYRRVLADGSVERTDEAAVYVRFNQRTGRFVVPTLLQEGKSIVNVWRTPNGQLVVDLHRPE